MSAVSSIKIVRKIAFGAGSFRFSAAGPGVIICKVLYRQNCVFNCRVLYFYYAETARNKGKG